MLETRQKEALCKTRLQICADMHTFAVSRFRNQGNFFFFQMRFSWIQSDVHKLVSARFGRPICIIGTL